MANKGIRLVTWNCNGCGSLVKRKKMLMYLKQKQTDIAFLQETHLAAGDTAKFRRDWVGQVFHSSFTSKQNGVMILVNKNINLALIKELKDKWGRIICIEVLINGVKLVLCNVYAPNKTEPTFFHEVHKMLGEVSVKIILAGDFNQVMDVKLDKSHTVGSLCPRDRVAIHELTKDWGLVDIWRLINGKKREYTFFSNCHKSYSRLDYFLISNSMIDRVTDCKIGVISLSDHALVQLNVDLITDNERKGRWRMNTSVLKDKSFSLSIADDLTEFFALNMGSTNISTVWECSKAYIRGQIIARLSRRKKETIGRIKQLEAEISNLEKELIRYYSNNRFQELCKLKFELNEIYNRKAEYALFRLKTNYYESGEKAGKLLSQQLKRQDSSHIIPAIETSKGLVYSPKKINEVFFQFYSDLYSSTSKVTANEINTYLQNINLPKITVEQMETLDAPITEDEVRRAILSMKTGKSPGADGIPAEYYKSFIDIVTPVLTEVFSETLDSGLLPPTFNEALISVIHKKGRSQTNPANYRPISLINVDSKILTKILATRLEDIIPSIINSDQVGFVKNRSSTDNLRRLLHLIWLNRSIDTPAAAISLDAEKAFDRVEWDFLFGVLNRFGFGPVITKWMQILYAQPKAAVITNGIISPFFRLGRGTPQGCPLSPLLFIMVLEPLATIIRMDEKIKGINGGGKQHKLLMYADDILWLAREPQESLPVIMEVIQRYSDMSGYKINWSKSEAMPISKICHPGIFKSFNFTWIPEGMTYLGVKLSGDLEDLIELNYEPLLQKMKMNLEGWSRLKLSFLGKINIIKMVVAPQFNYISMMIPLTIPPNIYKKYDNMVKEFLWDKKRPRIKMKKLHTPREEGGLALPDVKLYNLAFEISKLAKHWNKIEDEIAWVAIERELAEPFQLLEVLSQRTSGKDPPNPIVAHSKEVWNSVHKMFKMSQYSQIYASLWNNPEIKIGKQTVYWKHWLKAGLRTIADLFKDGVFMSYREIMEIYNLEGKGNFWKYLQLRSCMTSMHKSVTPHYLLDYLHLPKENQKASEFYRMAIKMRSDNENSLKILWQRDLGSEIDSETWSKILSSSGRYIRESRGKLVQYKILHRYYWTPCRLYRMGLIDNDCCWRCQREKGTFFHCIWECDLLQLFWRGVLKVLGDWMGKDLPVCPQLCLLGNRNSVRDINQVEFGILITGLITASRIILKHWKSTMLPELKEWLNLMTETASYENMLAGMSGQSLKRNTAWQNLWQQVKLQE